MGAAAAKPSTPEAASRAASAPAPAPAEAAKRGGAAGVQGNLRGMADNPDLSRAVFRDLDKDGNGKLDAGELVAATRCLGIPMTKDDICALMRDHDTDGDGRIDAEEFEDYVATRREQLRATFQALDANGDGEIDKRELGRALVGLGIRASPADVNRYIARFDYDRSGTIDFKEFQTFLMLLPATNVALVFEFWQRSLLDIGEGGAVPEGAGGGGLGGAAVNLSAGAVAGAVSRTMTAPLDRLKTLLQVAHHGAGGGVVSGLKSIHAEGGWRGFFRGNGANVVKIAPESGLKFMAFDVIKGEICRDPNSPTTGERLAAAGAAGAVAQFAIYPLETTKTRIALSATGRAPSWRVLEYRGIADCIFRTASQEGVTGLYRGLTPSLLGIVPYAGVDLAIFSTLKDLYVERYPDVTPGPVTLLACGAMSSTVAQLVSYPLALVRTRLQAQGVGGEPLRYNGMVHAVQTIVSTEGPRGLYRGIAPNFLKAVPAISISYATFETAKQTLGRYN